MAYRLYGDPNWDKDADHDRDGQGKHDRNRDPSNKPSFRVPKTRKTQDALSTGHKKNSKEKAIYRHPKVSANKFFDDLARRLFVSYFGDWTYIEDYNYLKVIVVEVMARYYDFSVKYECSEEWFFVQFFEALRSYHYAWGTEYMGPVHIGEFIEELKNAYYRHARHYKKQKKREEFLEKFIAALEAKRNCFKSVYEAQVSKELFYEVFVENLPNMIRETNCGHYTTSEGENEELTFGHAEGIGDIDVYYEQSDPSGGRTTLNDDNMYEDNESYPNDVSYTKDGTYGKAEDYADDPYDIKDDTYEDNESYPNDVSYIKDGTYGKAEDYAEDPYDIKDDTYEDNESYPNDVSYTKGGTYGKAEDYAEDPYDTEDDM